MYIHERLHTSEEAAEPAGVKQQLGHGKAPSHDNIRPRACISTHKFVSSAQLYIHTCILNLFSTIHSIYIYMCMYMILFFPKSLNTDR
jgi:hypothetical protein